jgi:hypothetical protein
MTERKRAEMVRAADESQSKEWTIKVTSRRRPNAIGTTEPGQGASRTRRSGLVKLLNILEEVEAEHMDR